MINWICRYSNGWPPCLLSLRAISVQDVQFWRSLSQCQRLCGRRYILISFTHHFHVHDATTQHQKWFIFSRVSSLEMCSMSLCTCSLFNTLYRLKVLHFCLSWSSLVLQIVHCLEACFLVGEKCKLSISSRGVSLWLCTVINFSLCSFKQLSKDPVAYLDEFILKPGKMLFGRGSMTVYLNNMIFRLIKG